MVQQYKLIILVIGFRILSVSTYDVPPINATVQLDGTPHGKFGDHEDVNNNLALSQVDSKMALVRSTVDLRAKRNTRRTLPTVWKREKRNNMHDYPRRPSDMDYYVNKMHQMAGGLSSDGKEDDESEYSGRHVVYRNADDGRASNSFDVLPREQNDVKKQNVKSSKHGSKVDERKHKIDTVHHSTKAPCDEDEDEEDDDDDVDDDSLEYQNENDKIKIDKTAPQKDAADNLQENSNMENLPNTNNQDTIEEIPPECNTGVPTTQVTTSKDGQDDDEDDYEDEEEEEPDEEEEEEDDGTEDEEDDDESDASKSVLGAKESDDSYAKHNTKSHTNDYPGGRHPTYNRNHGIKTPENFQFKNSRKLNNVHMKAPQQHSLTHRIKAGDDEEGGDSKDKAVLDNADDDDNRQHEEDSQEKEYNEDETNDDEINEDESNENESNEEGIQPTARKREKRNNMHDYPRRPSDMDYYVNKMQEIAEGLSCYDKEDDESEYSGRHVVYRNADDGRAADSCEVKPKKENNQGNKNVKSSEHGSNVEVKKHKTGEVDHKTKASSEHNNSKYQYENDNVNHIDKDNAQKTCDDDQKILNTLPKEEPITADSNKTSGRVTTEATTKKGDQEDQEDQLPGYEDDNEDEYEDDEDEDDDSDDVAPEEFENAKPILGVKEPAEGHVKQKTKIYTKDYHVARNLPYHRNHGIKTPENVNIKNFRKLNNVNMKALQQHSLTHKINIDGDDEGSDSKDKVVLDDEDEGVDDDNRELGEYSHEEQNEDEPNDDEINEDESNEEGDENEESKVSMNDNYDEKDIAEVMKSNACSNQNAPEITSAIKSKMCPMYIMVVSVILAILLVTCGCYFLFWLCLHRALAVESRATLKEDPLCACYSSEGSNICPANDERQ